MKIALRALRWSVGLEAALLLPLVLAKLFGNHIAALGALLGAFAYLGLYCHFAAVYLLRPWPIAQNSLATSAMLQWLIWFVVFVMIFASLSVFRKSQKRS